MNHDNDLNIAWEEWMSLVVNCLPSKDREQNNNALRAVEAFLSRQTDSELRSYVLGYGAVLKEVLGDIEGARKSLILARSLIGSSRLMFTHELGLAKLSQQQHLTEEARSWYRCALRTGLEIGDTSCAGELLGFLTSSLEPLNAEDTSLCMKAALLSWRVLALPGEPDLADLLGVAKELRAEELRAKELRANEAKGRLPG
jgi:hypothetical protein